jgi:hypothetical protein
MEKFFTAIGVAITALVIVAMALFLSPVIYIGFGYLGGLIAEWIFGGVITKGLNLLFNTDRFTADLIPVLTASLAMIGSYFKSTTTNNNKK